MVDQKHRRSLTVQAFWLLIGKTLAFIFAFALPVLLTRTLSQNEYGLFKQVFLIITTATALLPLGFGMSAYYYLPHLLAIMLLGVPAADEREKMRHSIERLQQFVYLRRPANSVREI